MHWILLFVSFFPSTTVAQRWTESVILTQHGPVSYRPVHHPRYGYFTADVLPVYPGDNKLEAGPSVAWPPYGTAFEVPITSGVNVGHLPLMTQIKSSSMKRKKSTLKKNPYYHKIPLYDKSNTKLTTTRQKHAIDSIYDQRFSNVRNSVQPAYAYRGRRFQNKSMKVRQSDKILKGQVIDHNKGRELQNHRSQARSNKNELENQNDSLNSVGHYFNNGHQGPDLSYFHYPLSSKETTDNAYY